MYNNNNSSQLILADDHHKWNDSWDIKHIFNYDVNKYTLINDVTHNIFKTKYIINTTFLDNIWNLELLVLSYDELLTCIKSICLLNKM